MADPTIGLRRGSGSGPLDVESDEELAERIRERIRRHGPLTFATFMDMVLYDPDGGYYRAPEARPGRAGDFLTAPELHPIFGATLATGLEEVWRRLERPDPFVVREHGAGTGALAASILDALVADGSALAATVRYRAIDVDPRRVAVFRDRLVAAGHGLRLDRPLEDAPFDGVVLANEVLDALPVHRVRGRPSGLREVAVALDAHHRFTDVEIDPTTPALAERLAEDGIELHDGQTAEVCLAADAWVQAAVTGLRRGLLLLIDYGARASELYDPDRRPDGTLRAYVRHQVHDDPYRHIGHQDLTAHVNVDAVERAAHEVGLATVGITTQAEALMGLGIEDRLRASQADPATTLEAYTLVRASIMRLLDPAAMGRFRVMAFGRAWPDRPGEPPLRMFAFRLPGGARRPPTEPG